MYDMYMYGADFHAACVGEAALEALAQCARLGLGELEPDVIHCEDGGSSHDGSGWTKVVAGPRRKHPQCYPCDAPECATSASKGSTWELGTTATRADKADS